MNTLKSLVVIGVLGVVCYGVYITLNEQPAPEAPDWLPPEVAGTLTAPDVQLGTADGLPPVGSTTALPQSEQGGPLGHTHSDRATSDPPVTETPQLNASHAAADYGGVATPPPTGPATALPPADARYSEAAETGRDSIYGGRNHPAAAGDGEFAVAADRDPRDSIYGGTQLATAETPGESLYDRNVERATLDATRGDDLAAASGFGQAMQTAQAQLQAGDLPTALLTLSAWYDNPRLTPAEDEQLNRLLDQLAGTVIYSRQSLIEPPHRANRLERLEDIAARYGMTVGLLAKINGLDPQQRPEPGAELKVVRGPFNAQVNVEEGTLTLMVGGRYAGRFAIRTAEGFQAPVSQYVSLAKTINPPTLSNDGRPLPVGHRDALQINRRLELMNGLQGGPASAGGHNVQIIGCNDPTILHHPAYRNAIILGEQDADDVFDILTEQSRVTFGP